MVSRPAGAQLRAGRPGALTLAPSGSPHLVVPPPSPALGLGWVIMTSVQHMRQGYRDGRDREDEPTQEGEVSREALGGASW